MVKKVMPYLFSVLGLLAMFFYVESKSTKIGFIQMEKVFNEFDMKKEYQKKLEFSMKERKKILDSLNLELKLLAGNIQKSNPDRATIEDFERRREFFYQKQQLFDEDNAALASQYDKEVIGQLKQYVSDYGKDKDYSYILGSNNDGFLMYGKETEDITAEVVSFINGKYKGK